MNTPSRLILAAFLCAGAASLHAQTDYSLTTTGTTNWGTATIWTPNGTPGTNTGDTVNSSGVASNSATISLGANRTIAGMTIQSNSSQVHTFEANAANQLLNVTGTLTKNASGEGRIHNSGSFHSNFDVSLGSVVVNAGLMYLGTSASTIDDLTVGSVSVATGTSLRLNVTGSANFGVVTTTGTGSFNIANGATTANVTRSATVTGISGTGIVRNTNNNMTGGNLTAGTLIINTSADQSFTGTVDNGGTGQTFHLEKSGTAQQTLGGTAANTFSGNTTLTLGTLRLDKTAGVNAIAGGNIRMNGGNLLLNKANQIADGVNMLSTVAGSTFNTGGLSETLGTLDLNANLTLDLGSGTSALAFAASNALDWTGFTLNISNWTVGTDTLRFGTTSGGLTSGQLAGINFSGYSNGAQIDASGFVTPIPEPAAVALIPVGAALLALMRRRKARA